MLIGLHGKARGGKDTAYGYIAEWAKSEGRPVRRDAFADRLKESAARSFGLPYARDTAVKWAEKFKVDGTITIDWGADNHPYTITGRQFLQYYGTEAHRDVFGKEFWVNAVLENYDGVELLVITDVRFPNEAEAIRAHGGQVWQIVRPGSGIAESSHASEQPLPEDLIDATILNDGSLDHFRDLLLSRIERRSAMEDHPVLTVPVSGEAITLCQPVTEVELREMDQESFQEHFRTGFLV